MKQEASFTIKVHTMFYIIKPCFGAEYTLYEIFTNCEKLFTLRKNNGIWNTYEDDILPISESLVEDIGKALDEYNFSINKL